MTYKNQKAAQKILQVGCKSFSFAYVRKVSLNFIVDNLTELGWDYTCGRMSRSGMEIYDGIMRHVGVIKPYEHWNEDVYADANGDW